MRLAELPASLSGTHPLKTFAKRPERSVSNFHDGVAVIEGGIRSPPRCPARTCPPCTRTARGGHVGQVATRFTATARRDRRGRRRRCRPAKRTGRAPGRRAGPPDRRTRPGWAVAPTRRGSIRLRCAKVTTQRPQCSNARHGHDPRLADAAALGGGLRQPDPPAATTKVPAVSGLSRHYLQLASAMCPVSPSPACATDSHYPALIARHRQLCRYTGHHLALSQRGGPRSRQRLPTVPLTRGPNACPPSVWSLNHHHNLTRRELSQRVDVDPQRGRPATSHARSPQPPASSKNTSIQ